MLYLAFDLFYTCIRYGHPL